MITLLQELPDIVFLSQLKDFSFTTDRESATFVVSVASGAVLNEVYTPDSSGTITVYDLDTLLIPKLLTEPYSKLGIYIYDGSDIKLLESQVVYCLLDISIPAAEYLSGYFLTAMAGLKKTTAYGRKEYLNYILSEGESSQVNVELHYVREDNHTSYSTESSLSSSVESGISTITFSPDQFRRSGYILLSFDVTCGSRVQSYVMEREDIPEQVGFLFKNAFRVEDTFYCTGLLTYKPEYERASALMGGLLKNYHVEEKRIYQANSGYLMEDMLELADDLARADDVCLFQDDGMIPVLITESEMQRTNADDELYNITITYRATRKYRRKFVSLDGIFDNTFDETFN